jgi:hypothetical protein
VKGKKGRRPRADFPISLWLRDTKTDNLWVHIISWTDLLYEVNIGSFDTNRRALTDKLLELAREGGTFVSRYEIRLSDPEMRVPRWKERPAGGCLMAHPETHGL